MKKFIIISCTIILLILSAGAFLFAQHYHALNAIVSDKASDGHFSFSQAPAKYTPSHVVEASGKTKSRTYRIPDCDAVDFGMTFSAKIKIGSRSRVTVSAPENLLDYIMVKAENGLLCITSDPSVSFRQGDNSPAMTLEIEIPALRSLSLSGCTNTEVNGSVDKSSFSLQTSGMSNLNFRSPIASRDIEIHLSGMTNMKVPKMKATRLDMNLDGISKVNATLIDADILKMNISGQSSIEASDKISCDRVDCSVSGMSDITTRTFMASRGKLSVTGISKFKAEESNASGVSIYSENSSITLGGVQMNPDKYYDY